MSAVCEHERQHLVVGKLPVFRAGVDRLAEPAFPRVSPRRRDREAEALSDLAGSHELHATGDQSKPLTPRREKEYPSHVRCVSGEPHQLTPSE